MSLGPGHRIVLRMTPDGTCEQAAFSFDVEEGQRSRFTWDVDDDTLLANRIDPSMSLLHEYMAELHHLFIGSSQATKILSVTDSQFTIEGHDGPIVYERIQSDPAFPDGLD
jgi:hypothetical protein